MADPRKAEGLSTRQAAALVGASLRQLTYWANQGWIPGLEPKGTGFPLSWDPGHIRSARMIKAQLETARALARIVPADQQQVGEGERLTA